jgi:hypothetical protein
MDDRTTIVIRLLINDKGNNRSLSIPLPDELGNDSDKVLQYIDMMLDGTKCKLIQMLNDIGYDFQGQP